MRNLIFFTCLFLTIFYSCQPDEKKVVLDKSSKQISEVKEIKYAKGFLIEEFHNYKIITLKNPWVGESTSYRYILYNNDKPSDVKGDAFIKIPIQSIACMSLTHIAFLEKLDLTNTIVALSGCDYVSSTTIGNLIKNKSIKEIGQEQNINYEMLVEETPNLIMAYGIDSKSNNYINKISTLGLDVVLNAEYMETHPLGKAEWIKFIAAFYDKDEKAATIFNEIEKEYLDLLALTKTIVQPTVFVGMPWNGSWYVPGGKSFQSQLFKDAGAQYLWIDNEEKGSLVKAKEIIIDQAYESDFWLNQNSYTSIDAVVDYDQKFKGFKAVKEQQLFNNDKRVNAKSGNDYWESGVINPHIILKDLIEIFHPQLIEHDLYYYRKLE